MHKTTIPKQGSKQAKPVYRLQGRERANFYLGVAICVIAGFVLTAASDWKSRSLNGSIVSMIGVWFGTRYLYLKLAKKRDEQYFQVHGKPRPLPKDWM